MNLLFLIFLLPLVSPRARARDPKAVTDSAWHPPHTTWSAPPPALTDEEKRSRIHYLRVAKTGSSAAIHYFQLTNCSRRVQYHTSHMDMQVPFPQRSVAVLREPCDRAGSLLSHLLGAFLPNRPSRYYDYNLRNQHSLRLSNKTSLLELAAFVATSGISRSRLLGEHRTLFFAQSRYIGPRTEVICYGSGLEASLQRMCNSTARLPQVRTPWHTARGHAVHASAACAAVRAAYSQDWALYRRHCLHAE